MYCYGCIDSHRPQNGNVIDVEGYADSASLITTRVRKPELTKSLLGFAGVFLHFKRHPNAAVAAGMVRRLEKRWAALDQDFFIMTLVLNPYKRVSHFGDQAGISVFTLQSVLMQTQAVVAEKEAKAAAVSQAFLKYMSTTGIFAEFEQSREAFEQLHVQIVLGNNPILVWEQFRTVPDIVGASIRREHVAAGFVDPRGKRKKKHDDGRVAGLIAVPQYADALDNLEDQSDEEEERVCSRLINSRRQRRGDGGGGRSGGKPVRNSRPPAPGRSSRWLPCPLSKLFGGQIPQPPQRPPRKAFTREQLLMELLATKETVEEPDDGELEGSGDDYE
ncbi:hypothetical protein B0H11DRAFT_1908690 [Mycena galericulata]|nr:hypothetical protein B0H11DRAFT_1908690 [Mycena galericulata]